MASDYVARQQVKDALEIGASDVSQDDFIDSKIASASRMVEDHANRRQFSLDDAASARVINPRRKTWIDDDGEHLLVDDIGSDADLVVEVGSESTAWTDVTGDIELEPTDAPDVDPANPFTTLLYLRNSFSTFTAAHRRVRVTARWGWPAVPAVVEEATLIQAVRLYKRKDSPEGVLGSTEWGATVRMSRLDPDVAKMLEKVMHPGFA